MTVVTKYDTEFHRSCTSAWNSSSPLCYIISVICIVTVATKSAPFCGACETKAAWHPTKLGAPFGILAVLRAVERLPKASHINSAMPDTALMLMAAFATQYLSAGGSPSRTKTKSGARAAFRNLRVSRRISDACCEQRSAVFPAV